MQTRIVFLINVGNRFKFHIASHKKLSWAHIYILSVVYNLLYGGVEVCTVDFHQSELYISELNSLDHQTYKWGGLMNKVRMFQLHF